MPGNQQQQQQQQCQQQQKQKFQISSNLIIFQFIYFATQLWNFLPFHLCCFIEKWYNIKNTFYNLDVIIASLYLSTIKTSINHGKNRNRNGSIFSIASSKAAALLTRASSFFNENIQNKYNNNNNYNLKVLPSSTQSITSTTNVHIIIILTNLSIPLIIFIRIVKWAIAIVIINVLKGHQEKCPNVALLAICRRLKQQKQGICIIRLISLKRFLQIPIIQQSCIQRLQLILKRMQQRYLISSHHFRKSHIKLQSSSSNNSSIAFKKQFATLLLWWRRKHQHKQHHHHEQQQEQNQQKNKKNYGNAQISSQILVIAKYVLSVFSSECSSKIGTGSGDIAASGIGDGNSSSVSVGIIRHSLSLLLPHRTLLFLILLSSLWNGSECFHGSVKLSANTVKTKYGLLRGIVLRSTPLVEAYLGIPYASPPVGSLRFMPPITPSTWKNVRNADRFSAVCPQTVPIPPNGPEALLEVPRARLAQLRRLLPLLKNQSEDCLYLNIYVPYENRRHRRSAITSSAESSNESPTKLSTILFIHGESYEWNSGNPYDGSELAANGNVIVVTINFRLGIFGFLKTGGKESAQGNFGLMDLVAGLHWLKENLPAFNGDPHSITILGHGTGAALANILIVSPVASDLIQRTVMVSGSALSPWAIQRNPLFVKRRVAEQTGCHGDMLYDDLAPCLRTKSIAELLAVKIDHPRFLSGFAPFVDGTVISPNTDSVGALTLPLGAAIVSTSGIEFANFPKRDLIFCLTSVESYLDLSAQDLEFGFNETRRDRILRTFVRNNFHYHLNEIFAVLKNEYTDWEKAIRNPLSARDAALSFLSDGHTASALIKLGYMHSLRGGRSYFIHFKHRTIEEEYPQRTGSVRGEDVPFWLGLPISPLFPHNYTTQEKLISRRMLRYLANFAKTGNPNQSTQLSPISSSTSRSLLHRQLIDNGYNNNNNNQQEMLHLYSSTDSIGGHSNVKRSSTTSSSISKNSNTNSNSINKFLNLTSSRNIQNVVVDTAAIEALNLAIIYNQRRSNAMRDKRTYYKRRLRSNNNEGGDAGGSDSGDFTAITSVSNKLGESDDVRLAFWDAYDVVNQLYLELGIRSEIQSHYRGHKLSMWLNLIPQLHKHFNINDQSMRHHQFPEDMNSSRDLYEGVVRPQLQTKPIDDEEDTVLIKIPKATLPTKKPNTTQTSKTSLNNALVDGGGGGIATTECGVDGAMYISSDVTTSQSPTDNRSLVVEAREKDLATASTGIIGNLEVLRRLSGKQLQSYTTALVATVAVGCFLLILNILIFAGIYHQREKRARDAKTKEELQDNDTSKNSSMLKLNTVGLTVGGGGESGTAFIGGGVGGSGSGSGKTTVIFGEYNCYDEKTKQQTKDDKLLIELPLPHLATQHIIDTNWACSTNTLDLLKSKHNQQNPLEVVSSTPFLTSSSAAAEEHTNMHLRTMNNMEMATYNTMVPMVMESAASSVSLQSKRNSFVGGVLNQQQQQQQFDYAVQSSDQMSFKAIEDAVKVSSVDDIINNDDDDGDDDIPEPPPPPKSFQQQQQQQAGGILRSSGSGAASTTSGKKRVHIQEISV